jgi:hypothetical protein
VYFSVKRIGATEMKTDQKIEHLESTVFILTKRLDTVESCGNDNDKTIGEIKIDLAWIKEGIKEIKILLGDRRES